MAVILVDMDDVLADFEKGFLERWRALHPDLPYVPLDQRNVFQLERQYPPEYRDLVRAVKQEPGFLFGLEPIAGGLDALRQMIDQGHEPFICTAPLTYSPTCPLDKFSWVRRHFGQDFVRRVILTSDKTLVRGDFLIDDRPDADTAGVMTPVWEHVVFDCPYNRTVGGKRRLIDWRYWRAVLGL